MGVRGTKSMKTYVVTAGVTKSDGEYTMYKESASQSNVQIGRSSGRRTQSVFVPYLADIATRLTDLLAWPEEWDGHRMAPSREAVKYAFSWIKRLYLEVSRENDKWLDPLIVADAFGNVVFEWWEGHKKLTVYVTPTGAEYVKVWGPDIFSDMEDGDLKGAEDRQALWHWLMN